MILDSSKYERNMACKFHDNAYGIKGGGTGEDRKQADDALYQQMKQNKDPLAGVVYVITRLFGWVFFNYKKKSLWKGQLSKRFTRK